MWILRDLISRDAILRDPILRDPILRLGSGRARLRPCRPEPIKSRALAPEGTRVPHPSRVLRERVGISISYPDRQPYPPPKHKHRRPKGPRRCFDSIILLYHP